MQPTDYALGVLFAAWLDLAGWGFVIYGVAMALGGLVAIVVMIVQWGGVTVGPDPDIPPVDEPPVASIRTAVVPAPNYHRSGEYPIVPHIPGATPQAGPVCPTCGGPFHPVCPSAPKVRINETVEIPVATEPQPAPLSPQFAALGRFFESVDEARADTEQAMRRLAANARPDCPLTTHELVIPTVGETPVHRAIADREPTQELSKTMAKIMEAQR